MFDVCCLGILVTDITTIAVDCLPEPGKILPVDGIKLGLGGCAANAAIDLQKIGAKAAVLGKVGNDTFGSYILNKLLESGVDIGGIKKSASVPTSSAIVLVNGRGERSFLHCSGANGDFTLEDVDYSVIRNSRTLFIAGALLMPELDGHPTARILAQAQADGVYTALDTSWDTRGRWMEAIAPCLAYLNLFIPSIDEAKMLSGESDVERMADVFLRYGLDLCVIKMGRAGCYLKSKTGEQFFSPGFDRVHTKDTNGAGDSFAAGFLAGLINGWDNKACAEFANAVGAHCVSRIGSTAGIKSMSETLRFVKEYSLGNDILMI